MDLFNAYFLKPYRDKDIVLRLKAVAAFIFNLLVLLVCIVMGTYFFASGTKDPYILLPFTFVSVSSVFSLAMLRKGKFQFAANLSFASVQTALWLVMFFEKGGILQRLDSIILIAATFAYMPLLFIERRRGIWLYYAVNMILLTLFALYSRFYLGMERWDAVEFFMDSSLALTFIAVISYLIFTFHTIGITTAKKAEDKVQRQYEELSATYEELEAMNEELAAINEELDQTQQDLMKSNINLQKETAQSQTILLSISDGIITTDEKGMITSINRAAIALFGIADDAVGNHFTQSCQIYNAKTNAPLEDPVDYVLAHGKPHSLYRDCIVRKNGSAYNVHVVCTPLYIHNAIAGCIVDIRDVTDLVRYEEELFKSSKYESLSVFAGGIAHDFNNMLSAILGNLSIIETISAPHERIAHVSQRAQTAIFKARDLTTQLLAFSKGGAPVKSSASLVNIIKDTAEFVLSGSSIQCRFFIDDNLDNALVDPAQISQVIHNIILNARQAIKQQGTIAISAKNVTVVDEQFPIQGPFIQIIIQDTGGGIPQEVLPYIFDPFFTTRNEGHGLGLSIAYSIIKKHDGHITVESTPEGTAFTIYVPIATEAAGVPKKAISTECLPVPMHILVMDDDALILESLSDMLSMIGCTVKTAAHGAEALDIAADAVSNNNPFEIAILDITNKAGKGGIDVINDIKQIMPLCRCIAATGYANEPIMVHYKEYGFDALLQKPYTLDQLLELLSILGPNNTS